MLIFVGLTSLARQVCGQNPAYDFFPSQHQIFYRGRGEGQMWYDPVFKVVTIKGEEVRLVASRADEGCCHCIPYRGVSIYCPLGMACEEGCGGGDTLVELVYR